MSKIIGVTVGTPLSVDKIKEKLNLTADDVTFSDGHTFQQKYESGELRGQPGYTPRKGIDYFDGYTPIKNVDYFDGEPGNSGVYVGSDVIPDNCNVQIDPSGSVDAEWVKIDEITFSEDGTPMSMTYNNLGGMTEFLFKVEGLTNGTTTSGMTVTINGIVIRGQVIPTTANANNYCYVELTFNGLYWKHTRTGSSTSAMNWAIGAVQTPYNIEIVDGATPAETMVIGQHPTYFVKAGKLIIYGKRPQRGSVLRVYDEDRNEIEIPSIEGKPPSKGIDYWTVEDKAELVSEVLNSLPVYSGEVENV